MAKGWISIKGQKVNLDRISAIIDEGDIICFRDDRGIFLILSMKDIPGGCTRVNKDEFGRVRTQLLHIGERWV